MRPILFAARLVRILGLPGIFNIRVSRFPNTVRYSVKLQSSGEAINDIIIMVPVWFFYQHRAGLRAVLSKFYPPDGEEISCMPFQFQDACGNDGELFTIGDPYPLSNFTDEVGSIWCVHGLDAINAE